MVSNHFKKIYNLTSINSTVHVVYLNNKTVIVVIGESVALNVIFMVENLSNSATVNIFNNGYYYY